MTDTDLRPDATTEIHTPATSSAASDVYKRQEQAFNGLGGLDDVEAAYKKLNEK